jgi:hypothetical protein
MVGIVLAAGYFDRRTAQFMSPEYRSFWEAFVEAAKAGNDTNAARSNGARRT